jgi:hypothetical protein
LPALTTKARPVRYNKHLLPNGTFLGHTSL